jgi:hypothetical protein
MTYEDIIRTILVRKNISVGMPSAKTQKVIQGYCKSLDHCQDALEFLGAAIHDKGRDPGYVELLDVDTFINDNLESLPGMVTSPEGYFVFGTAGDGSSFMIDIKTAEIFLLSIGCVQKDGVHTYEKPPRRLPINRDSMLEICEISWKSPREFLEDWKAVIVGEKEWNW